MGKSIQELTILVCHLSEPESRYSNADQPLYITKQAIFENTIPMALDTWPSDTGTDCGAIELSPSAVATDAYDPFSASNLLATLDSTNYVLTVK